MCDEILRQAVEGISDLITTPGIINIDFADVRAVLENAGSALMGVGSASGENRATEAAKQAINSPLLDVSISGAKGVLFSIAGGEDLTMFEIQDAAKIITESIDPNAKVIFGTIRDDKLKKNEIRITVIAAGFPETSKGEILKNRPTTAQKAIDEIIPPKEERRRIFNAMPSRETPPIASREIPPVKEKPVEEKKPVKDDDDDWGAIPAFLRRSKLK